MSSQSTAATRDVEVRIEYLFPLMSLLGARQPPLKRPPTSISLVQSHPKSEGHAQSCHRSSPGMQVEQIDDPALAYLPENDGMDALRGRAQQRKGLDSGGRPLL